MGARLMRRWIALPLKDINNINERLNVVEYLMHEQEFSHKIQGHIKKVGDLERLVSKVATARVNPRELKQLQLSLYAVEDIKNTCSVKGNKEFGKISMNLNPCRELADSLSKQLTDEPPLLISKGNIIANGVNDELDELRNISSSAKDYLQKILEREIKRTNISSLKIGFNNVFGYYLEVTHTHKEKVPEDWHRKQTLTGSERYITEELKDLEDKILGAQEKIISLEQRLYDEVVQDAAKYVSTIQINSTVIAELDCLSSFSKVSLENNYSRPEIVEGYTIDIRNGRHPVIEFNLPPGESYIPNDVYLDSEKQQIIILTGPNMSGKSALLRQTALIILMGQMGCMVPAESAKYGFVDKVFTRVGASDNISSGESTFMVEMNETASILNNISNRSLILLDEIGRGTSTYDGISIAWSIAEFLHNHPAYRSKVLFATHYHELNDMSLTMKRIKNYHISIKEHGNKVIFLRKLTKGGSEHSFGIHVAEMAGMPKKVTSRAKQMLKILEKSHSERQNNVESKNLKKAVKRGIDENLQLSFIQLDDPLLNQIKNDILNTDVDTLTPVEALMKLNEIKKTLGS
jgi:DNA mismatch repair protein MutS